MKVFNNFNDFSNHISKIASDYKKQEKISMIGFAEFLERSAKEKIGHLQQGAGQFESWQPLAESTKKDKARKNYVFNEDYNPLLREGNLRDSIRGKFILSLRRISLQSNDPVMEYQEYGTRSIPPRSTLRLTMYQSTPIFHKMVGKMLKSWILTSKIPNVQKD